jgi:MFS family permease
MQEASQSSRVQRLAGFGLVVSGTVIGIAGTDLVLPAVPALPSALGGSAEEAQFVLAGYVFGSAIGLLTFGELGARFNRRLLLGISLLLFGLASIGASVVTRLDWLIALRVLQGAFGAAPAVFAPGLIRALYGDQEAVGAMGRLGSIEALTPALAPIAGIYLLNMGGWQASFQVVGTIALLLAGGMILFGSHLPPSVRARPGEGGYLALLGNPVFLRYALSQAFSLGSILVFVFGMPAVLSGPLRLNLSYFLVLQVTGVACFIFGASLSALAARRLGTEKAITGGTVALAVAFLAMAIYASSGGANPIVVLLCFVIVNLGFGLRGPAGFHRAVVAAGRDDARGAALVVLGILGTAAGGTAVAAPVIAWGLAPLAAIAATVAIMAVAALVLLPRLRQPD